MKMRLPRRFYLLVLVMALLVATYIALSPGQGPAPQDGASSRLHLQGGVLGQIKEAGSDSNKRESSTMLNDQKQTFDGWPVFSRKYFPGPIPKSPFSTDNKIQWDFNTTDFLQRQDIRSQPPKIVTWMVKTRYMPDLPEPVRLRFCPEMPCRVTTNQTYSNQSAALLWAGQIMRDEAPPLRTHWDQVFVLHNHEPQTPDWIQKPSFRNPAWKSAFNWTMNYRFDSDLVDFYGKLVERTQPVAKNYTAIVAKKTKFAAWLVSHCSTHGKREEYVKLMRKYVTVDAYGACSPLQCPRNQDDTCFQMISQDYKFFLSLENAFCRDYISEKLFRYLEADVVVVARGSNEYHNHAPPGTFVNANDFKTVKELTDHLLYLEQHPKEYMKILQSKDRYRVLYEEYPIRSRTGDIVYMHYRYGGVPFCELCRRLWDLDRYRKVIPDIVQWFDKENCYEPTDLH